MQKILKARDQKYILKRFQEYYVPFVYATNGRPYLEQYKEKIWNMGLDTREPLLMCQLQWQRGQDPEEMILDLQKDVEKANKKLAMTGYEDIENPKWS